LANRFEGNAFRGHVDRVLISSAADVSAAADQGLQGFVASLEIADLNVEPFLLEVAALLRNRERKIGDQGLAADRDPQARFFQAGRIGWKRGDQQS
jgi:hypothetical protein